MNVATRAALKGSCRGKAPKTSQRLPSCSFKPTVLPARVRNFSISRTIWSPSSSASFTQNPATSSFGSANLLLAVTISGGALALLSYTDAKDPIRNDAQPAPPASISTLHAGHQFLGIHLWGSNRYNVVSPDLTLSNTAPQLQYKKPKYLNSLSGQSFRDLKLHEQYAVAVTSSGDLLQWGTGYSDSQEITTPIKTLQGQNVVQVSLTPNKIYARTKSGRVLILPASRTDQLDTTARPLPSISFFWRLLGYKNPGVQYIEMAMSSKNESKDKTIVDISAGRSHLLALTSSGRVVCAAVDEDCNEMGQMGGGSKLLSEISSLASPKTEKDGIQEIVRGRAIGFDVTLKEIPALRSIKVEQIAAGDKHSLALTSEGRVLGWGNNTMGQLALGASFAFPTIPTPTEANLNASYPRTSKVVCTALYAGGDTSYFLMQRQDLRGPANAPTSENDRLNTMIENTQDALVYNDILACGNGMYGQMGNGQFLSVGQPVKVKTISGLTEFSEASDTLQPIRIKDLSVSATHTAIVLENAVNDMVGSKIVSNFGNDVYLFGHNDNYQLGTGKRSNLPTPQHISPLPYANLLNLSKKDKAASRKSTTREEEKLESGSTTHMPHNRLQLAPRRKGVEERIVCGYGTTAVYWHTDA